MAIKPLAKIILDDLLKKPTREHHSHATKTIDPEIKRLKISIDD
tara:strand:- start:409 stop:540 length:132 start_codon:yes stop_codon:yes gene_type:complete